MRVYIPAQSWGVFLDTNGNAVVGATVSIDNTNGAPATTWTAQTGGSSTTADQATDAKGSIPRYIEEGEYDVTISGNTYRVEATARAGVRSLPNATGIDDTANLNASLALTGHLKGPPGAAYIITSPLVISGNTILDLTDCSVTLKPGTGGNMLNNTALTAARSVIDAGITSASNVLTSATAAFTSGDVGKAVTVTDAGSAGQRLFTTIAGFTNSTTVTMATTSSATGTNKWVTIGPRDDGIELIGGLWDRGANGSDATGKGYSNNSIRLRRVDGVRIRDVNVASTNGKYSVNVGDVWDFSITGVRARTTNSDVVHVNGPAFHGVVRDTSSEYTSGDDIVSITASDFNTVATMADTAGDVSDILVDGVTAGWGGRRGAICMAGTAPAAFGGRAVTVTNVTIRTVRGYYSQPSVHIGGDFQDAATLGGTYTGCLVEDVKGDPRSVVTSGTVLVAEGTFEDLTIRGVVAGASSDRPIQLGGTNASQVPTVKRLVVDRVSWSGGTSPNGVVTIWRGTITSLSLSNAQVTTASTGAHLLVVSDTTSTPTISRAEISNCDLENAAGGSTSSIVRVGTGTTLGYLGLQNIHTKNVTYPLGRYFAGCKTVASNIQCEGAAALVRTETGTLTLQADKIDSNTYSLSTGGGTFQCLWLKPGQLVTTTAAYTITGIEDTVTGDATTAAYNVTLLTAVGYKGRRFTIKKIDASANAVTVNTTSSQTIDGATTYALATRWKYVEVESDGANWLIVANN